MTAIAHPPDAAPDDEIPDPEAALVADTRSITGQGFRLIARLVKLHPLPFVLSLLGGIGWAALVVGASYALGRVTDEVIDPAFKGGVEASAVWWAVFALFLIAVLRGLSVVVRRWFGSLTEARMQVSLRSSVVDRLLVMPLRSYRARPTGELLANADVDVLTTTQMLMPLPFSLGVVALAAISLVSLFLADWAFALVALLLFPALALLSRYYTNRVHAPAARVQERLGEVSSIAHESFDGALVVKTLGREEPENARFADAAARLRVERLGVARMTSVFEPLIDLLPSVGTIVLLLVGAWRIDSGGGHPRPARPGRGAVRLARLSDADRRVPVRVDPPCRRLGGPGRRVAGGTDRSRRRRSARRDRRPRRGQAVPATAAGHGRR